MKLANFLKNLFDRRWIAIGVIFYVAVAVSMPTNILADGTPADSAFLHTLPPEECSALGLSAETLAGGDTKILCSSGWFRTIIAGLSKPFNGGSFTEMNNIYDKSVSLQERQRRFAEFSQKARGSINSSILSATYRVADQRPASGLIFAADVYNKVVLPDAAYAQTQEQIAPYFPGTGFELLSPIRLIWGYLVGVSYSFMILLIVGISLALMFRAKIDGGQAVQLQNAIPNIVMAMILIPLSYPISGIFIDGITLGGNIIHGFMFGPAGPFQEVYNDPNNGLKTSGLEDKDINRGLYLDDPRLNLLGLKGVYTFIGIDQLGKGVGAALCQSIGNFNADLASNCADIYAPGLTFDLIAVLFDGGAGALISEILALICSLIFTIFAFFTSLRIFWELFKQFVTMMTLPMASPIIFALIAIPGQGTKWIEWYAKRMGNVTANFLAAYGMLLLSATFASPAFMNLIPSDAELKLSQYQPPLLGGGLTTLVTSVAQNSVEKGSPMLFLLLAIGIFVVIPGVLRQITDALAPKMDNPFMKLFQQEFKTTSDWAMKTGQFAFRQAPAATASAYNWLAARRQDAAKKYGDEKPDGYFGKSRAEKVVENERLNLEKARQDVANAQGDAAKRAAEGRLRDQERKSRAAVRAVGAEDQLFGKKGENPPAITANIDGLEQYQISGHQVRRNNLVSQTLVLKLVLKVPDNTTPPIGEIFFSSKDPSFLTTLINKSQSSVPGINVTFGTGVSASSVSNATDMQRINGVSFSGQTKVEIPVVVDFSRTPPVSFIGTWEPEKAVSIAVGDGKKNMVGTKLDPIELRISITN